MKPTLQDHLILCDMDNTLLTARDGLPECNRRVISLFVLMGGRFTVATGRPPESIRAALGGLPLSIPAIACNGALIYDLDTGRVLHRVTLDRMQASIAISDVEEKFPQAGVEIFSGDGELYITRANNYTHAHQVDERIGSICCPIDEVPDGWLKVVFAADPGTIEQIKRFLKTRYYGQENYFVHTNSIYYEIMPAAASKASAMRRLCELMGVPRQNAVVIGDYYNDLDIMRAAGYAVAVANAPDEVKAAADEVTMCTCSDGGVGEFLYKLIPGRASR